MPKTRSSPSPRRVGRSPGFRLLLSLGIMAMLALTVALDPRPGVAAAPAPAHAFGAAKDLERRVVELCRAAGFSPDDGRLSVSIRRCDGREGPGPELVSINASRPMLPASTMKVVSTGASLHELGVDFEFRTRVVQDDDRFVVIGDGDPSFGDPAFFADLVFKDAEGRRRQLDEEALLGFWADAIAKAAGEDPIRLEVDDSVFEQVFWRHSDDHPRDGWNPADRLKRYSAEVAGLNFHRNTFHFRPDAVGGGMPDWSDMRPRHRGLLAGSGNRSSAVTGRGGSSAWISRRPESNQLTFRGGVKGRFPETAPPLEVTFHDPPLVLLELLAERLEDRGVAVAGSGRAEVPASPEAATVGPLVRAPILPLVEHCNEQSQNLYAESLLKRTVHERTGRPGGWSDAEDVVKGIARERLGPGHEHLLEGVRISDGSGLSRGNRVTARFMTAWLDSFDDDPALRTPFVESLSRGGDEDDGTLGKRFGSLPPDCRIDGKSGYINGVSALAGFVTTPDGRRWVFSILFNGPGADRGVATSVGEAKRLQERIVNAIARHGLDS